MGKEKSPRINTQRHRGSVAEAGTLVNLAGTLVILCSAYSRGTALWISESCTTFWESCTTKPESCTTFWESWSTFRGINRCIE